MGYHFCGYLTLYKIPSYQGSFAGFEEEAAKVLGSLKNQPIMRI